MEKWIVDRIEEGNIILEKDEEIISVKMEDMDISVKEGDILIKNNKDKFILDEKSKISREKYIKKLTKDLWEN